MKAKQLLFTPENPKLSLDSLRLGEAVTNRFKEILINNEASLDSKGIKVIKRELAMTIRRETGHEICLNNVAKKIDDAVSEYIDNFVQNLHFKDAQNAFFLSQKLIHRIYSEIT